MCIRMLDISWETFPAIQKKNGQDEAGSKIDGELSPAEQSTGQEQGCKEVCVDAHRADAGLDEEFKGKLEAGWQLSPLIRSSYIPYRQVQ